MKKIKLNLSDLLLVLEQLAQNDCEEILIYEGTNGYPVIVDINYLEDQITFAPVDDQGEEIELPKGSNDEIH